MQFLIAAFDLICFLRPLPLCGGVTKASAFGDTAFLREKAVRKRARGKPLDPRTADVLFHFSNCMSAFIFLNDLTCFSFRSAAAAVLVRAAALRRGEGRVAVCRATKGPCVPLI